MRRSVFLFLWLLLAAPLWAQMPLGMSQAQEKQAALNSMGPWLGKIDTASYSDAWKETSATFQRKTPVDRWVQTMRATRTPFGPCQRRSILTAFGQPVPPGPGSAGKSGYFVVAQFDSYFFDGKHAMENVVFEKQPDGSWRAAGYTIQPKS